MVVTLETGRTVQFLITHEQSSRKSRKEDKQLSWGSEKI